MAVLFGCGGLLLAYRVLDRPLVRWELAVIGVLLLAATLCKEYGLAALGAAGVVALLAGRQGRQLLGVLVGVGVLYLFLRLVVAGGATEQFCEDAIGLKGTIRAICYGNEAREGYYALHGHERIVQYLWNIGATGLGTALPTLFTNAGSWQPDAQYSSGLAEVAFVAVLLFAIVGWLARPRLTLPLLALIVGNALMSFYLFRTRNQVMGMAGLYASAGVGLTWFGVHLRVAVTDRRVQAGVMVVATAFVALWLGVRIGDQRETLEPIVAESIQRGASLCEQASWTPPPPHTIRIDPDTVRALKHAYDLPDPDCTSYRSGQSR